jgi:lysozyme family protein
MSTETFGRAHSLVFKHEGGYVDHPRAARTGGLGASDTGA